MVRGLSPNATIWLLGGVLGPAWPQGFTFAGGQMAEGAPNGAPSEVLQIFTVSDPVNSRGRTTEETWQIGVKISVSRHHHEQPLVVPHELQTWQEPARCIWMPHE
jgi:hypothetical protein